MPLPTILTISTTTYCLWQSSCRLYITIYIYLRNQYFHLLDLLLFSPFRTIHHYYWLLASFYKEITVSCSGVGNLCPQPKRVFCTLWKIITLWHQCLFWQIWFSFLLDLLPTMYLVYIKQIWITFCSWFQMEKP